MLLIKLLDRLSRFVPRTCFTLDAVILPALCLNQILEPVCFLVSLSTLIKSLGVSFSNSNPMHASCSSSAEMDGDSL